MEENARLRAEIAVLLARIEELERRLGINSKNSSKPPSSDPLPIHTSTSEKTSEPKKRGARHGHKAAREGASSPRRGDEVDRIRGQAVAHADKTGWRRGNRLKGWLGTLGCSAAAFFQVQTKRNREAAQTLLGSFLGIFVTDRLWSYNGFPGKRHCWAYRTRDFFAIGEAKERLGEIGRAL